MSVRTSSAETPAYFNRNSSVGSPMNQGSAAVEDSKPPFNLLNVNKELRLSMCRIDGSTCDNCKKHWDLHSQSLRVNSKIYTFQNHRAAHASEVNCEFCDSMFPAEDITQHMRSHEGDLPFSCKVCFMRFQSKLNLNQHFVRHTTKYSCDVCNKGFRSDYHLTVHKSIHIPDDKKTCICETCEQRFGEIFSLNAHVKKWHTEPPVFTCSGCEKTFQSEAEANKHAKLEQQKKLQEDARSQHVIAVKYILVRPFKCEICKKLFPDKGALRIHLRTHDSNKPRDYICYICHKAFATDSSLKRHNFTHVNDKSFHCMEPGCGLKFSTSENLRTHKARQHPKKPLKLYDCSFCDRKFKSKRDHSTHVARHLNERRFGCEICQKRFYTSSEIICHRKTHSNERPYTCSYCVKTYKFKYDLTKHIKIHVGEVERKQICKVCGKGFPTNKRLNDHLLIHSKEKELACNYCSKRFRTPQVLREHVKIHTGEKPEICQFCSKRFLSKSALQVHINRHVGEKPFICHHIIVISALQLSMNWNCMREHI